MAGQRQRPPRVGRGPKRLRVRRGLRPVETPSAPLPAGGGAPVPPTPTRHRGRQGKTLQKRGATTGEGRGQGGGATVTAAVAGRWGGCGGGGGGRGGGRRGGARGGERAGKMHARRAVRAVALTFATTRLRAAQRPIKGPPRVPHARGVSRDCALQEPSPRPPPPALPSGRLQLQPGLARPSPGLSPVAGWKIGTGLIGGSEELGDCNFESRETLTVK